MSEKITDWSIVFVGLRGDTLTAGGHVSRQSAIDAACRMRFQDGVCEVLRVISSSGDVVDYLPEIKRRRDELLAAGKMLAP